MPPGQVVLRTRPLEARRAGDAFSVVTSYGGRIVLDIIPAKRVYRVLGPPSLLHWVMQCGLSDAGSLSHLQMASKRATARAALCTPAEATYQCMLGALPHLGGQHGSPLPPPDEDWSVLTDGGIVYFADEEEDTLASSGGGALTAMPSFGAMEREVSTRGVPGFPSAHSGFNTSAKGLTLKTSMLGSSLFSTRRASKGIPQVVVGGVDVVRLVRLFRSTDERGEGSVIYLDGPHMPPRAVVSTLVNSGRFRPPGVLAFLDGAVSTAWLPPCTRLDPPAPCGAMCVSYDKDGCGDGEDLRYFRFLPEPVNEATDMPAVETVPLQQRYQITSDRLGGGGFGTVYRGVMKVTGAMVAVKIIPVPRGSDACITRCRREFDFMQELVHPNIVQVHAFEVSGNRAMIVMELCESGTLLSLLRSFKQGLPLPALSHTLRQVLHGVRYLHLHNVVHRDLKPANILCSASGLVKVADFGAAHRFIPGASQSEEDEAPAALTPVYASPEANSGSVVFAQDIWALGCIAIEMVTCKPPWSHLLEEGLSVQDVTRRVTAGETHPIPAIVSAPCRAFISGCFTHDHTARPECSALLGFELFLLSPVELAALDKRTAAVEEEPWAAPVALPGWSAFASTSPPSGSPIRDVTAPLTTTSRDDRTPCLEYAPEPAKSEPTPTESVEYLRTLCIHRDIERALKAVLTAQPKTRHGALALLREHLTE
eukprot:Hpha_TRINITY_DN2025_c0_g1::TRINITY_DN2025_c0_g1_i1::g.83010::m.83010